MTTITIPLEIELTERSRAVMEALAKVLSPRHVDSQPEAATVPRIGEPWPGQGGLYAGISRGEDGEPDAHLILLDDAPESDLCWADAVKWAEGLGNGARLPTRFESALLYANVRDKLDTGKWHWTGKQYSANGAWGQDFNYGSQLTYRKYYEGRGRPVRRLPL